MEDNKKINLENILALLNQAENNSDTSDTLDNAETDSNQSTPRLLRSAAYKGIAVFRRLFENGKGEEQSVPGVINCLVKVMSGMYRTISDQGKQIKEIFEELKGEKARREALFVEIQKKYEELERKERENVVEIINERLGKTEKALEKKLSEEIENRNADSIAAVNDFMKKQKEKMNNQFGKKLDDLEKELDEGRQREMKGTLIISSPERGQIRTEAVARNMEWEDQSYGMESELDMVLRMIHDKTGIWFPYEDVEACHQFGKPENHSFVLKIWNRKKFSSWDELSWGMLTGNSFDNNKNIFINFMLTTRRTELSKQVRKAKKDRAIAKYSIDPNGKIYIKQIRGDNRYLTVTSVEDLNRLKKS